MASHTLLRLTHLHRPLIAAALIASALALSACATVDAQTTAYVGVEHPAPTLPAEVQILRTEPTRPSVRLGEILIDASVDPAPPITQVEQKLREEGAKLGADAVVVVYDQIQPVAAYVTGPLWNRDIDTIQGRKLKGIAIKYQ
jgi:putative NIF3 family GTP cyclohydrolase 1 type 2